MPRPMTVVASALVAVAACAGDPFLMPKAADGYLPGPDDIVALHWVRALARDDRSQLRRNSGLPFIFRSADQDRHCEGTAGNDEALAATVTCLEQRPEL